MNNNALQNILGNNVVELTFVRRHEKLGWNSIRGLLGTTNYELLNGPFGGSVLHFRPPKGVGMGYDYKSKNLCVVWDFFRQEYRVFGAEQVSIRKLFDLNDPDQLDQFYEWFYEFIINMTEQQKLDFMGYEGEAYAVLQQSRHKEKDHQTNTTIDDQKIPFSRRIVHIYNNVKDLISRFLKKKK